MNNLIALINKHCKLTKLNIGSGKAPWLDWTCIDELDSAGIKKCKFSKDCVLPAEDNSQNLVYSSHCLEHLDDPTVGRLLRESKRILAKKGKILIKIPDFDLFLNGYRQGKKGFMDNIINFWPSWSWKNFNITDNDLNRMSYFFCGYWNKHYGDHFSGNIVYGPASYNGPARMCEKSLKDLFSNQSIREITKELKKECLKDKNMKSFNHQNAWSKVDLVGLLDDHGFKVLASNQSSIREKIGPKIPDFDFMGHWSMYVLAEA
ncbi:MAG: methyltransferase domain-containing protein [Paracoccaceae bacterium]